MIRTPGLVCTYLVASAFLLACGAPSERTPPPMSDAGVDAEPAMSPAAASPSPLEDAEAHGEDVVRGLERVRAATERFRDLSAAHDAGYPTTMPGCVDNPPEGGMGLHYTHPELLDDRLEVERPEILVYAPPEGGEAPELVGVEYVVPFSIRGPDEEAPRIFGRALKPSDALQLWYLHVWAWESNSNGLFADWNPAVEC